MAIEISSSLVLTKTNLSSNNSGALCYINYLNFNNVSATSEEITNPATNMANPATAFGWIAESNADQVITVDTDGQEIDYIGIARHNLNQEGLSVTVKYDGVTVISNQTISDNQAILFLQSEASPSIVTIEINGATEAPRISVLYVGKSTRMQRNLYVGHTPITYGRSRTSVNGVSENGQYLGEIVVRETNSSQVSLTNLTPDWYRNTLDPYFSLKPRPPCFWAWRQSDYPDEVGYAWIEGNPTMSNSLSNGMVSASWTFKGIV